MDELTVGNRVVRKSSPLVGTIRVILPGNPYSGYQKFRHDRARVEWEPRRWYSGTTTSTIRLSELLPATIENVAAVKERYLAWAERRETKQKARSAQIYAQGQAINDEAEPTYATN